VIPTIPVQILFNVLAGLLLAHQGRALIRAHTGSLLSCAPLRVALAFEAVVMWPIVLYLYVAHPAWDWMYWTDPHRIPGAAVAIVLFACLAALVGGFAAGFALTRAGKYREHVAVLVAAGVGLLAVIGVGRRRLVTYGTFESWQSGNGLAGLGQVKLGYTLTVLVALLVGALLYACHQLHLAGRRIS
jgi:hypothetical protein